MPLLQNPGSALFTLTGTAITTSFTASSTFQVGRANRLRIWGHFVTTGGSSVTTITYKLQHRFNDGTTTLSYRDMPVFHIPDLAEGNPAALVLGAAPQTLDDDVYLDLPNGVLDLVIQAKADHVGQAGDTLSFYGDATLFRA
jgi:hypothetical protein